MCYVCGQYGLAYGADQTSAITTGASPAAAAGPIVRDYTALTGTNGGSGWNGQDGTSAGSPVIVTYSFETSAYSYLAFEGYSTNYINSFRQLNSTEKAKATEALNLWDAASGISFIEVPAGLGDIRFGVYNFDYDPLYPWAAGYANYPGRTYETGSSTYSYESESGGDVFLNSSEAYSLGQVHLYTHELGHALGFKHPFDDTPTLASDLDNISQTVMSYTGSWGTTLGPLDINAVRYRYGTADHTNTSSWAWNAASLLLTQTGTATANRIMGVSVRDLLSGGEGNDTLAGFAGNDTINGDGGLDVLYGGTGNDSVNGGAGNDTMTGDEGNDTVNGGAGDDYLLGDVGDDTFLTDAGADSVYGDSGFDSLSYANATIAVIFDGSFQTNNAGAALGDRILYGNDIERVIGSSLADTIRLGVYVTNGNGGGGNDSIYGDNYYSLSETLDGGAGNDVLTGYLGSDTYFVDSAADVVVDSSGITDTVIASVNYILAAGQGIEVLRTINPAGTGAINLTGNEVAQTLQGNAGANQLDGGGGADLMYGYAGNDIYYVDDAGDKTFENLNQGSDTVRSRIAAYTLASGQYVEVLALASAGGTTAANLTGNSFAQSLFGNAGANVLNGGGGADTMTGYAGSDTYYIDIDGDRVVEAVGGGNDTIRTGLIRTVLAAGQEIETVQPFNSTLTTAITLIGNEFAQRLFGNAGANTLEGKGGADTMTGYAGDDIYFVTDTGDRVVEATGGGRDTIRVGLSSFVLEAGLEIENLTTELSSATTTRNIYGNEKDQSIYGNAGSNVLDGKLGNDVLIGNGGRDYFTFSTALGPTNIDRISDFAVGTDIIRLENAVFTAIGAAGSLDPDALHRGAAAHDPTDRIIHDPTTGALYYDSDGTGTAVQVRFATLSAGLFLISDDFLVI